MKSSYQIATVFGIPIRLHISLLILILMLCYPRPLQGLLIGVGILVSIVLHELGHSAVAIRKGCRVREITLMFGGGAAMMEEIPRRPMDEFLMAIAGPAVSLGLAVIGFFGGTFLQAHGWPRSGSLLLYLGIINGALMAFNLLPAFPMDGGRVFRAALTPKLGRERATFIAARLGRIIAIIFGIYGFFSDHWILVMIALFVYVAAGKEYQMVRLQEEARRQGFDTWPPIHGHDEDDEVDGDTAVVSPPPYESGRGTSAKVHPTDEDSPFRRLFGSR